MDTGPRDVPRAGDNRPPGDALLSRLAASRTGKSPLFFGRSFARMSDAMTAHPPRSSSYWHEVLIGRSMAACVHPIAAWQSKVLSFRVLLVASYFVVGYLSALAAIAVIQ
jgi:hypothetical protein